MSPMASGEMSLDIDRFSVSNEFRCAQSVATVGSKKLSEYAILVDCDSEIDQNYKAVLMCLLHGEKRSESRDKWKSRDYDDECNTEALTDPQYESFLNDLKEQGKSYVLQYERDGSTVVYGYEDNNHLEKECNLKSRRSIRIMGQQFATLNQTGGVGNQCEQVKESLTFHNSATVKNTADVGSVNCNTATNEKTRGFTSGNKGRKRKFNGALEQEIECSDQMPGGKNQHEHNAECNLKSRRSIRIMSQQFATLNQTGGVGNQCEQVKESLTFHNSATVKNTADIGSVNCNTATNEKTRGFTSGNKGRKRKFNGALEQEIECSDQMPGGKNQHEHNARQTSVEKVYDTIPRKPVVNQDNMSADDRSTPNLMVPVWEIECTDKMPNGENLSKHNSQKTSVEKVNDVIPMKPSTSRAKVLENVRSSPKHIVPLQEIECADQMPHEENQRRNNPRRTSMKKVNDVIPRKPATSQAKMLEDVISTSNCMVPDREIDCSDHMPGGENQHKHDLEQTSLEKVNDVIPRKPSTNCARMSQDVKSSPKHMASFQEFECTNKMPHRENQHKHNSQETSVEKVNDMIPRKPSSSWVKMSEDVRSSPKHVAPFLEIKCANQIPLEENQPRRIPRRTSVKVNDVIPMKPSTSRAKTLEDVLSTSYCRRAIECSYQISGVENRHKHYPQHTSVEKVNDMILRKPSRKDSKMSEDVRSSSKGMTPFQEIECTDQMLLGENQHKHNPRQASAEKINDVISRNSSTRGAKMLANVRSPPNNVMPVPKSLHCHQSVEHWGNCTAHKLNVHNIENNMANRTRVSHRIQRQSEFGSIGDQRIDLMTTADNQCNHDLRSVADKTRNDNDKVEKITGFSTNKNKYRRDSLTKQDMQELKADATLKVGPSNEISGAKNQHGHYLRSASVMKPKSSKMRSRNKAQYDDIVKCSYEEYIAVRAAESEDEMTSNVKILDNKAQKPAVERSMRMESEDEMASGVKIIDDKKPVAERSMRMKSEDEMVSDVKIFDNKKPAAERSMRMEIEDEMDSDVEILDIKNPAALLERDEFRKMVLEFLRRPFDKEEYVRYQEAAQAGSYYLYHGDLERKLKKNQHNQRKRLTIFRAFFFWLENVSHPGAFKPWKEREFLAVEPGPA